MCVCNVCTCVCVCLQAAPNLQYFSKGASAGARLFAVIHRQPAIDAGTPPTCPGALTMCWLVLATEQPVMLHVGMCEEAACCVGAEAQQRASWYTTCVQNMFVSVPLLLLSLHPAEDPTGEEPAECVGELRLEHVSFRYPARPDVMVMRDFCLEVKAGVFGCTWRQLACLLLCGCSHSGMLVTSRVPRC
jgi:ATP-binding cassette subfamily B (MDR/TAP) protein 1